MRNLASASHGYNTTAGFGRREGEGRVDILEEWEGRRRERLRVEKLGGGEDRWCWSCCHGRRRRGRTTTTTTTTTKKGGDGSVGDAT